MNDEFCNSRCCSQWLQRIFITCQKHCVSWNLFFFLNLCLLMFQVPYPCCSTDSSSLFVRSMPAVHSAFAVWLAVATTRGLSCYVIYPWHPLYLQKVTNAHFLCFSGKQTCVSLDLSVADEGTLLLLPIALCVRRRLQLLFSFMLQCWFAL